MSVYNAWLLQVVLGSLPALAFAWAAQNSPIERHVSDVHYSDPFLLLIFCSRLQTLVSQEKPRPLKNPKCGG